MFAIMTITFYNVYTVEYSYVRNVALSV